MVNNHEFKVGDKVYIPKTKSIGGSYDESNVIAFAKREKIEYLYVVRVTSNRYVIHYDDPRDGKASGDYFLEQDLELYRPEDYYVGGVVSV